MNEERQPEKPHTSSGFEIHCTAADQVNSLLKNGWHLENVTNSTPTGFGFVYALSKIKNQK